MNSIQDRALRLVELKAEDLKTHAVVRSDWANTGNIYIYADASLSGAALLTLHYDFQKTLAYFYPTDEPVIGKTRPIAYRYSEGFDEVLAFIEESLTLG